MLWNTQSIHPEVNFTLTFYAPILPHHLQVLYFSQLYADDTLLYVTVQPENHTSLSTIIEYLINVKFGCPQIFCN